MESRLNPNAAEFVPSPTSTKPSMEELISQSPVKGGVIMDDVSVPSLVEFQQEVSLRPSELDINPFAQSDISGNSFPDLPNGKTDLDSNEKNSYQLLENEPDFGEFNEQLNPFKTSDHLFDKSEVSSTKAEYGDETSSSFVGNISDGDYLKTGDSNLSAFMDLDASMTESDFVAANSSEDTYDKEELLGSEDTLISTRISDELTSCFELRKDLIPTMDSEGIQMPSGMENVCSEVNSTPLNQELGLEDLVFPNPVHPSSELVLGFDSAPLDKVPDSTFALQQSALSPNADAFDLGMDFTEPTICSPPPIADVHLSSVTSKIQNLVLESETYNFSRQEVNQLSPVLTDPFVPEISNLVQFESPTLFPEYVHDNLPILSQTEEVISCDENSIEIVEESQQKEPTVDADVKLLVSSEDKKEDCVQSSDPILPEEGAAAAVAATLVTAGAVAALSANVGENKEAKVTAKKPVSDKGKSTPTGKSVSAPVQKASPKTTPTSPTKPLMPTPRSASTPKKPTPAAISRVTSKATTTSTATSKTTTANKPAPMSNASSKITSSSINQVRVKVGSAPPTKPTAPVKLAPAKTTAPPKPRPATAATTKAPVGEKKPGLSNGDIKPIAKRTEPLAVKKSVPAAASKPLARPASAPVASRTTKTSTVTRTTTVSANSAKPLTKPAVNGVSKPKTSTTTATTTLRSKPPTSTLKPANVDKQVKDSANKQISSVTAKSSSLTRTGVTSRKPLGSATKTTTTTTVTKSSCGPIKRPASSTVTKTTTSKLTAGPTENEMVVVEEVTSTVTKDDSPVIDNAQMEVISPTN